MAANEKTIILAVTGGVAAFKAVTIASRFFKDGHDVHVFMTPGAQEFVQPLSFSAITRHRVVTSVFPEPDAEGQQVFPHLYPSTHADVFCVAPATADVLAKLAHGESDNIVCAAALPLPAHCRRYFCPAMNAAMWENPAVQENARTLRDRGWIQIGPDAGLLACGDTGYGRMVEPDAIADQVLADLSTPPILQGKTILITSGPTRERIDPVRYITNDSSGKMGKALAEAASRAGAAVAFVTGPVHPDNLPRGPRIQIHKVESALDMLASSQEIFPGANAAIFAAAVADFRPATAGEGKLEKNEVANGLALTQNPDIAATLSSGKNAAQTCIGFALQTHDGPAKAKAKLQAKHLNAIVLNGPDSLGSANGTFTLITPDNKCEWGSLSKAECARNIIEWLAAPPVS